MERKEAIEVIKKNWSDSSFTMLREALETLIPELEESEDERIRKGLIDRYQGDGCICNNEYRIDYKDIRAWLEKQGEQSKKHDVCDTCDEKDSCISPCCVKLVEEQGGQKPADKVEPKFKVGDVVTNKKSKDTVKIVQILHDSYCYSGWDDAATVYSDFSISEQDDWELVELTAWSEEGGQNYSEDDIAVEEKAEYKKGFECGKQLVLKYPEDFDLCKKTLTAWSEEDEEMMSSTVFYLNEFKEVYQEGAQKCISWLKSLKGRYTWKPSESDIRILEQVIDGTVNPINYHATLYAILEQLKKLREE